jgi:hypothetical protein
MDIETSNAIKLFFPNPSLVQVFFEALANALDAGASEISIRVEIQSFTAPDTLKITITDNGQGFTEESFERFKRLLKTQDSFHKGLGRLVFLIYFARIAVDSTWGANRRTFIFSESFEGASDVETFPSEQPDATTLVFTNFIGEKVKSYDYLKPGSLKERIIEHFLPTLCEHRRTNRSFTIKISLQTDESNAQKDFYTTDETITAADLPELTAVTINDPSFDAYEGIEMLYQVKSTAGKGSQLIAVNIDGRTIPVNLIQPPSVPFNHSIVFLFSSKLFHAKADTSRQKLVLPEGVSELDLLRVLRRAVGKVLAEKIPQISEKNEQTKEQFEERFPHLLGLFEETTVGLIDKDEALDIAQRKFFKAQKEVLQCEKLDDSTFEKSLELSSRTLTEYILYRDKMIRRMKEMTQANSEAEIHNLIVPRWKQFHKDDFVEGIYRNNAWLLDDKFMSFQTILSEARMDTVIQAIILQDPPIKDDGRPDITMIFSADPNQSTAVDVVVVEVKRISDKEKDNQFAINQLLARARKLIAHCPNIQRIWYYAIIPINNEMAESLFQQNFIPMFSKGHVFYNEFKTRRPDGTTAPTSTFVMSFDAIVADAESRNHTFLEILKSGMRTLANAASPDPGPSSAPATTPTPTP